jgi:uncharacterized protein YdcH (DUF465 family)
VSKNKRRDMRFDRLLDDLELLRESIVSMERKVEKLKQDVQSQEIPPKRARRASLPRTR